ncbi:ABC transporter C-terminal domain-containing protein [Sphingomonas sp.]|uniref:ABC transporter C-terminal domain-containing protein n=1 Tax=Sphingomonas sp. TaxID=28214 RepID=UPI0035C8511B
MTAAHRLKGLGWFGGVTVVALGLYLVSLQVAAERKKLEQLDAKIAAAEREIRALETEFDTRASLAQLERWNGDTLALVAPTARQFIRDDAQFAAISFRPVAPGSGEVRTAALVVPAYVAPVQAPTVIPAVAPAAPVTVKAVAVKVASAPLTATKPVARKMQAVAMLDGGLLSDSTLGDLVSGARSEARRLR